MAFLSVNAFVGFVFVDVADRPIVDYVQDAQRAVLWSRLASRVLWPIAGFDCGDEHALYDAQRACFLDPHDPAVQRAAEAAGGDRTPSPALIERVVRELRLPHRLAQPPEDVVGVRARDGESRRPRCRHAQAVGDSRRRGNRDAFAFAN